MYSYLLFDSKLLSNHFEGRANVQKCSEKCFLPLSDLWGRKVQPVWKTMFSKKCSPSYCIGISFPVESIWGGFAQRGLLLFGHLFHFLFMILSFCLNCSQMIHI